MCLEYISKAESFATELKAQETAKAALRDAEKLDTAIVKGLRERAAELTRVALRERDPLDIVEKDIIPALDAVGVGYEKKTVYLPELLMSAEAAKAAFEVIKEAMPGGEATKGKFVLATVEGDIHDIGKNIVKLLLENYGYEVIDLGKDVKAELVVEAAKEHGVKIVGLSALMTTTLPSMEKTVRLLKEALPDVKTVVGGAVLTEEYAERIGASKYAKDAMETIRYTEEIMKNEL
jgi:5-methyltetrahydrofolate--homocysteine methyltransferase